MKNLAYRLFRKDTATPPATGKPAEEFRPLPLLSNPHLQTVIAAFWSGPTWNSELA